MRYLVKKQNKDNFVEKIRRFVDSRIVKTCDELDLWLHLALVLGEAPGVDMGVIQTLKSSIDAKGANSSFVVIVLVATLAMLSVFVPVFTRIGFCFFLALVDL